eukprot:Plantae.Rhodophyta-Purpureofilum_apyrenoidigerum.ctg1878.p3 GENE.Plantae.Rhodophyta-Purpureofilum_apyrenoidigerum.ctg1878~~Plantae.Rhodophyta-Purpureofilum_apyrenoidigerum.ctg1878.p3  ORF type:complete len:138 (-),score=13.10 Plantae.Rhodophyta-Purpureofilum_apyrenoidigerum.ctg1878:444-857(-)
MIDSIIEMPSNLMNMPAHAKRPNVLDIKFLCGQMQAPAGGQVKGGAGMFCSICLKMFSSKGNMRVHMNVVHGAQRDFECDLCQKRFGTKNNLHRHIDMVHKKERPFECTLCRRRFTTKSCVKRHELTHQRHVSEPST